MNPELSEKRLAATLYPLTGTEKIQYNFRILKIRERIPDDNLRARRLQQWADRLWRKELRCPIYPTNRFGFPAFLIPEEDSPPAGSALEIPDVPDKHYHVDVTGERFRVALEEADNTERELACRMTERPFSDMFLKLKDKFWKSEWTLFFRLEPENAKIEEDVVYAYRGLKFGVVYLQDRGLFFATDIRTRYVGKKSLIAYSEDERRQLLGNHLDVELPVDKRASFLRDNGRVKLPCRFAGETGTTVGKGTIDDAGITVHQYYGRRYQDLTIDPNEAAVYVQDRKDGDSVPVPISRLFPIFTTEYAGVKNCSVRPQMTPEERIATITAFLGEFSPLTYGGQSLCVGQPYLSTERIVFVPPRLEFGNGAILEPFPKGVPTTSDPLFDRLAIKWLSGKMPMLYKHGPYHFEPLPDVILLYPPSVDRNTREAFLASLTNEVKRQTSKILRIVQQRQYKVGRSEQMGSSLIGAAIEENTLHPRSLVIAVLWEKHARSVHRELKEALKDGYSQCVTERVVKNIVQVRDPQRATSQLRNLALAVLTETGTKPWVLADDLHHDLHLGIDLLFGKIGYHFLYGKGGRMISQAFGESLMRGRLKEAIKTPDLKKRLEASVTAIVQDGYSLRNLVIHRDGRWWPSESRALHEAIANLQQPINPIVPKDMRCAVVEVRKYHFPVRLFTEVRQQENVCLQNPLPGTYLALDQKRALLTPTGRPGSWDTPRGRTAATILLELVDAIGAVNIEEIVEDAYRLTHLNWNAPDIEIALPVTIRWADESLRETFRSPAEEDEDDELEDDETDDTEDGANEQEVVE